MKESFRFYLNCIPLTSEELYNKFLLYRLTKKQLGEYGFPVLHPQKPNTVIVFKSKMFGKSQNPEKQICRCGKELSLFEEDWHIAVKGCVYHPAKRITVGPDRGRYRCCKKMSQYDGCAMGQHHVSDHSPIENATFVTTALNNVAQQDVAAQTTSIPTTECVAFPLRDRDMLRWGMKSKTRSQTKNPVRFPVKKSPTSNIFALDCEMAYTTAGMEVVKVTLVNIGGDVVFDSYVKPSRRILDYNTLFSGVTARNLDGVTMNLKDVQTFLLKVLNKDSILVGHGLENDMLALNMVHESVVDTSCMFPHKDGFPLRNSLKYLAAKYLHKPIQSTWYGHNSIEDANTCMELVLWKIYMETNKLNERHWSVSKKPGYRFIPWSQKISTQCTVPPPAYYSNMSKNPEVDLEIVSYNPTIVAPNLGSFILPFPMMAFPSFAHICCPAATVQSPHYG
ncbi:exonuclease GOR-like [Uloborus diversus]|uniref:exonuclease GOR-like n=1 Tax=Uloborus diversus TaxID=327109 RepID=UPI0024093A47|nr:exonuclease GOR-like [Uloborus diversus]